MKRVLLAVLAVALLAGGALAAIPAVNLQAIYTEDGSAVDVSAIVPYKEVEFRYTITADTPSVTYQFFVMGNADGNNIHNIHNTGTIASTAELSYKYKVTFSSKETGYVSLFVTDANNMIESNQNDFTAVYGVPPFVPVTGIELSVYPYTTQGKNISMDLDLLWGKSIKAIIIPDDATNKKVTWASGNEKVATIDQTTGEDIRVNGIAPGKTTITATTEDGSFKASCDVTVTATYGASAITLDPQTLTLTVGGEKSVWVNSTSFLADYQTISWDIQDPSIAQISEGAATSTQGWGVRGLKAGTTTITATTIDKKGDPISATATVTVTNPNNGNGETQPPSSGENEQNPSSGENEQTPGDSNNSSNSTPASNPDGQTSGGGSGGGGCNTGWMGLFALALLPVVRKYRTTAQR